jgi:hypothetical protein
MATRTNECSSYQGFTSTFFGITKTSVNQGVVELSPWQLTDEKEFEALGEEGSKLVFEVRLGLMRETLFLRRINHIFPELAYFKIDGAVPPKILCALLVIYWLSSEQAVGFTRGQSTDGKLSDKSWSTLQHWTTAALHNLQILDVVFVAVALGALGTIPKFHAQLAPDAGQKPKSVLQHVIKTCPAVLPSYMRLKPEYKTLLRCMIVKFDVERFLLAESLPANLTIVKEMLEKNEYDVANHSCC